MDEQTEIRFIDLFGGIGGFRYGLEQANLPTINGAKDGRSEEDTKTTQEKKGERLVSTKGKRTRDTTGRTGYGTDQQSIERTTAHGCHRDETSSVKGTTQPRGDLPDTDVTAGGTRHHFHCVWYCDNNKHAVSIYNKRFNEQWKPTDIHTVDTEDIPDFDMLCAGFPCQAFSIAGRRKGFQDIRGTLFYEICRIAKAKRPRILLLENVKGLLSIDNGRCFTTIITSLDELGYDVQWQILNSKHFGVPQNRERVFIIGHLRENGRQEILPL